MVSIIQVKVTILVGIFKAKHNYTHDILSKASTKAHFMVIFDSFPITIRRSKWQFVHVGQNLHPPLLCFAYHHPKCFL